MVLLLGFEGSVVDECVLGIAGGFDVSKLKWEEHRGKSNIWSYFAALYSNFCFPDFYFNFSLLGGQNNYDTKRYIQFSGVDRAAESNHWAINLSTHFDGVYDYVLDSIHHIRPFLEVDYSYLSENGYKEKNAQGLNLTVKDKRSHVLKNEVGVRLQSVIQGESSCVLPMIWLSWVWEKAFRSKYSCIFENENEGFHVIGYRRPWNRASTGLEFDYTYKNFDAAFKYSLDVGNEFISHTGEMNFSWNF